MMKLQGCSWLLETGKICIDKTTMFCFNLLTTSYYSSNNYLLTESEVFTVKYQTEALLY